MGGTFLLCRNHRLSVHVAFDPAGIVNEDAVGATDPAKARRPLFAESVTAVPEQRTRDPLEPTLPPELPLPPEPPVVPLAPGVMPLPDEKACPSVEPDILVGVSNGLVGAIGRTRSPVGWIPASDPPRFDIGVPAALLPLPSGSDDPVRMAVTVGPIPRTAKVREPPAMRSKLTNAAAGFTAWTVHPLLRAAAQKHPTSSGQHWKSRSSSQWMSRGCPAVSHDSPVPEWFDDAPTGSTGCHEATNLGPTLPLTVGVFAKRPVHDVGEVGDRQVWTTQAAIFAARQL
jgi:hypothetical protein